MSRGDDHWGCTWNLAVSRAQRTRDVTGDTAGAELMAIRALGRFGSAMPSPGLPKVRATLAKLPRLAQEITDAIDIIRAAAAGTPSTQPERRAALDRLHHEIVEELQLDPDGPAERYFRLQDRTGWRNAEHRLEALANHAIAELDDLPPSPPRAPDAAFDRLIGDLGRAYTAVTGRQPSAAQHNRVGYLPPFAGFVHALWSEASDERPPSLKRMAGALRREARIPIGSADHVQKGGKIEPTIPAKSGAR